MDLSSQSTWRHAWNRIAADPHVVLAVAIVFAALVIELVAGADAMGLVVPSAIYLTIQMVLALRGPSRTIDGARHRSGCSSPSGSSSG